MEGDHPTIARLRKLYARAESSCRSSDVFEPKDLVVESAPSPAARGFSPPARSAEAKRRGRSSGLRVARDEGAEPLLAWRGEVRDAKPMARRRCACDR